MFNELRLRFYGVLLGTMALFVVMIGSLLWTVGAFPVRAASSPLEGGSYKAANANEVPPGGTIAYTILLSNSGGSMLDKVVVTDALDPRLDYDSATIEAEAAFYSSPVHDSGLVTFTLKDFEATSVVTISLVATLDDGVASGEIITNTATISDPMAIFATNPATFTVSRPPAVQIHEPDSGSVVRDQPGEIVTILGRSWVEFDPPPFPNPPILNPIINFGDDGDYSVDWNPVDGAISYNLQESSDGTFENPVEYNGIMSPTTMQRISGNSNGTYAYRVVAYNIKDRPSRWSNVQTVEVTDGSLTGMAAQQAPDAILNASVMISVSTDGGATWHLADEITPTTMNSDSWWEWSYDWELGPDRKDEAVRLMARAFFAGGGGWTQDTITVTVNNKKYYAYFPMIYKRYPPIPYAPKTFYAEGINDTDGNFSLVWDYGYSDFTPTSYELDESTDGQNWTRIANNVTGNRLDLSRPTGTYYYRVRGVNTYGASAWTYLSSPVVVVIGFFDDFSNPNSGWAQGVHYIDDRPVFDRAYENGSYRMKILLDGLGRNNLKVGLAKAPYNNTSANYSVEVSHRFAEAEDQVVDPSAAKAGLVFGANGDFSTIYVFEWNWEGACAVSRYDNVSMPVSNMDYLLSQWSVYRDWGTCSPLRTGYNEINTIRVDVQGNGARFYINGSEISSNNPGGIGAHHQVGLMTGSWQRTPVESRFDNFRLTPQ